MSIYIQLDNKISTIYHYYKYLMQTQGIYTKI